MLPGHSNDTWDSRGGAGGGRSRDSVTWPYLEFWLALGKDKLEFKNVFSFYVLSLVFGKSKCYHVKTWGGGRISVPRQCHQMTHGGGGKKGKVKKCNILFEWPLLPNATWQHLCNHPLSSIWSILLIVCLCKALRGKGSTIPRQGFDVSIGPTHFHLDLKNNDLNL